MEYYSIIDSKSVEEEHLKQFLRLKQEIWQDDLVHFMKKQLIDYGEWFLFALYFHEMLEKALQFMFQLYDNREGKNSKDFVYLLFNTKIKQQLKTKLPYKIIQNLFQKNKQEIKIKINLLAIQETKNAAEKQELQRKEQDLKDAEQKIKHKMQYDQIDMVLQFMEYFKPENEKKGKQRVADVTNLRLKYLKHLRATPKHIYAQMVINLLRKRIDCYELKDELMEHICCQLYFDQTITFSPKPYNHHEFQRFEGSKILDRLDLHVKLEDEYLLGVCPVVVAFLNGGGGIYYRGIKQNQKDEPLKVVGVKQTAQSKKAFLQQLRACFVRIILPEVDSKTQEQEEIWFQASLKKIGLHLAEQQDYYISKYISVEFLPIVDPIHMANKRTDSSLYYIVKIKVQQGDTGTVYHMETHHKASLDGFKRNAGLTQKYDFEQFRLLLETRCREKNKVNRLKQIHTDCYFKFVDKNKIQ